MRKARSELPAIPAAAVALRERRRGTPLYRLGLVSSPRVAWPQADSPVYGDSYEDAFDRLFAGRERSHLVKTSFHSEFPMSTPSRVEVVEVIFVTADRGDGTPTNPHRSVCQYWSKDGRLLADFDSLFDCPEAASYMAVERLFQVRADEVQRPGVEGQCVDIAAGQGA